MIKYLLYISFLISFYQLFTSCATQSSPTGGPRDTIPPVRLFTIPLDKSLNYKDKTFEMEFDERIKTDKLKDQLIITPLIEFEYEYTTKKNTFKITFEESFKDSTTYTLNFRESLQDITEGNPTKENKFTFSTGNYIDSMSIEGYVKDLLTYDTLENVIVGLYNTKDTITIFDGSPYYFNELDEEGKYQIDNIKNGRYLLYAFQDENKNLKLESNNEAYGFSKDTILLDSSKIYKNLDLISLDLSEFRKMTAITSGKYFDINFNKSILNYTVTPLKSNHELYTNLAKENKSIRFYNNFDKLDSLQVTFTAYDSILSEITDTVFVKFLDSRRKTEALLIKVEPEKNSSIESLVDVKVKFNKPIIEINTDSVFVQYDTTRILQIDDSIFQWNKQKDELTFQIEIDKSKADTVISVKNRINQLKRDSIASLEEPEVPVKKQMDKKNKEKVAPLNKGLQLYFGMGSFYSADLDTSYSVGANYKFIVPEENGTQNITVNSTYEHFTIQFLKENFTIVQEIKDEKSSTLKNIPPGKYKIRVLIDANNDGVWSPGNMRKQIEPEPVYIYPEEIVIRAEWETTLELIF